MSARHNRPLNSTSTWTRRVSLSSASRRSLRQHPHACLKQQQRQRRARQPDTRCSLDAVTCCDLCASSGSRAPTSGLRVTEARRRRRANTSSCVNKSSGSARSHCEAPLWRSRPSTSIATSRARSPIDCSTAYSSTIANNDVTTMRQQQQQQQNLPPTTASTSRSAISRSMQTWRCSPPGSTRSDSTLFYK